MEEPIVSNTSWVFRKNALCFLVFLSLILLWLPNVVLPIDGSESGKIRYLEAAGLGSIFWIMAAALCKNIKRLLLISIPFAIILPMELWIRIYYGTPITDHIIALAWESNLAEAGNLLVTYGASIFLAYMICGFIFLSGIWSASKLNLHWQHRSRYWYIAIFAPTILLFSWVKQDIQPMSSSEITPPSYFDDELTSSWLSQWSDVFPMNLLFFSSKFLDQRHKMEKARDSLNGKTLDAWQTDIPTPPDIVIIVIGESASASHWGALGYKRNTTPKIQKHEGVAYFSNVASLSSATRTAIPGVLSRKPFLTPIGAIDWDAEPSFLKAFAEVGYSTHWLSNQAPLGRHDTSISVYAKDASDVRFLNPGTYGGRSNYDEILLQPLGEIIKQPGRHIVVLHLLGSHFNYGLRYPKQFDIFQPSLTSPENNYSNSIGEKTLETNSYDNSIAYTDHILDQVIDYASQHTRNSIVAYFSDHGVDLPNGRCSSQGVSRISETSFHVPALLWAGHDFRGNNKKKWETIIRNVDYPYSTNAFFSSILELSGITIKNGLPLNNFLTPPPKNQPRMVATGNGQQVDFDMAKTKNPCYITSH